ncbi:tRNA (adenosine(37)-N6)-threonylcarbamoyltransferase complex dimerization subunit type 1 TsaB [Melissococcus plutonius]|uniref:tRNA (adenosine(37)-N6)-threonylcarbamoyltransferase complex dimerization subunit type 1 TsaB n=1 Tax=Melissococcus plutonius TaxID=33970 RepID=UPI003C2E936E
MRLLAMDTSNQALSVAVCEEDQILGEYTTTINKNHSITLMPTIDRLMHDLHLKPTAIDRFVVARGPGSYTGLRIGITTAKTLAYTLKKELTAVSSLETLAANCVGIDGIIIPLFDARRENIYTGAYTYDEKGKLQTIYSDRHIALTDWLMMLQEFSKLYFVGVDVKKFEVTIKKQLPQATINKIAQWQIPCGAVLAQLGKDQTPLENIHTFSPSYLKRVEAEENWLKTHTAGECNYVEKI